MVRNPREKLHKALLYATSHQGTGTSFSPPLDVEKKIIRLGLLFVQIHTLHAHWNLHQTVDILSLLYVRLALRSKTNTYLGKESGTNLFC